MSYGAKQSIRIIVVGLIILAISSFGTYHFSKKMLLERDYVFERIKTDHFSKDFENIIIEKIKTIRALSLAPILSEMLNRSNREYYDMGESSRDKKIDELNEKWKITKDQKDKFIQKYINNDLAEYFKDQQDKISGEYGEIFLTNKYGALVASTEKLTTFAHGKKYWWLGAYDDGNGKIFLDDRGYDDSVGGYVLGIVIAVRDENEIAGILKVNINIIGSVNRILLEDYNPEFGKFVLIRSGGEIIVKENTEPLSERVPTEILKEIQKRENFVFPFNDGSSELIVSFAEIQLTSGTKDYRFGGSFESVDHKKGNSGESWIILNFRNREVVLSPLKDLIRNYLKIGSISIMFLALGALFLGFRIVRPIKTLTKTCRIISEGNFDVNIDTSRTDEIGSLSKAFSKMASDLKRSVVSRRELLKEVDERRIAEKELELLKNSLEVKVEEKTSELTETVLELKRAFDAMVGRELKMKELYDENEKLKADMEKMK